MPSEKTCRPRSLRARLLAVFVAGMGLSAGLVALGVWAFADPFSQHMLSRGVEDYSEGIATRVQFDAQGRPTGVDDSRLGRWVYTGLGREVVLRILDDTGRVVYAADAPDAATVQPLAPAGQPFDAGRRSFALTLDGVDLHAATQPLLHEGRRWYLQFAVSDRLVLRVRRSIGVPALLKGVAATVLAFFALFLFTTHVTLRRALGPLQEASEAAQRITPRTLGERLDVDAQPVEIQPLITAFNLTLDRLQQGFRTQQDFLASTAHELKTPLALIRGQLELGPQDARSRQLLEDVDRMARQIQQLLMLAEVSEPQNYRLAPLDPRGAMEEVYDFMSRVAARHSVYLCLRIDDDVRGWQADKSALFTLLKNLLENAIQHSPAGGVVTLAVQQAGITVRDQGPGVPQAHLAKMFERFWRGPERREDGAGLGLAICTEIATAHGWRLRARCGDEGLEVQVLMAPEAG